jgi:hypothetical protein
MPRLRSVIAILTAAAIAAACTSPTSPATARDCGGGVQGGSGTC